MDATSYFARIALANRRNVKIVKEDYWIFFPFSTQVKIIEYLIINFPKRVFCHPLPFGENEKAIKQKRKLLEGLEKIADMREVVANVKRKLSIRYDLLEITPLDNFSVQCYPARKLYADTHCWKESLREEMWDISHESERCKYFSIKHERHELLHHRTKVIVVNMRRLYKLTFIKQKEKWLPPFLSIKESRESVINSDNFCCPSRCSNTNHRCMYKRGEETNINFNILNKHFWALMKHDVCTTDSSKFQ